MDKILLLVGTIFSFLAAGVYPLMFFMYGRIASTFIDLQKEQILESLNITIGNLNATGFW
jgi:hypothetical protein